MPCTRSHGEDKCPSRHGSAAAAVAADDRRQCRVIEFDDTVLCAAGFGTNCMCAHAISSEAPVIELALIEARINLPQSIMHAGDRRQCTLFHSHTSGYSISICAVRVFFAHVIRCTLSGPFACAQSLHTQGSRAIAFAVGGLIEITKPESAAASVARYHITYSPIRARERRWRIGSDTGGREKNTHTHSEVEALKSF